MNQPAELSQLVDWLVSSEPTWRQIAFDADRIEREKARLERSCAALDHLTVRLVIGDLTLAEAVALADPLLQRRAGFASILPTFGLGLSRRQAIARFLIQRAEAMYAGHDPSLWYPVWARLEQEYACW
jgi:hypothetical protein